MGDHGHGTGSGSGRCTTGHHRNNKIDFGWPGFAGLCRCARHIAKRGALAGMDDQEVARRTPDDIEAHSIGDDIVAKQLREAALAEEDPVLRERLWDEYRKYKGM